MALAYLDGTSITDYWFRAVLFKILETSMKSAGHCWSRPNTTILFLWKLIFVSLWKVDASYPKRKGLTCFLVCLLIMFSTTLILGMHIPITRYMIRHVLNIIWYSNILKDCGEMFTSWVKNVLLLVIWEPICEMVQARNQDTLSSSPTLGENQLNNLGPVSFSQP